MDFHHFHDKVDPQQDIPKLIIDTRLILDKEAISLASFYKIGDKEIEIKEKIVYRYWTMYTALLCCVLIAIMYHKFYYQFLNYTYF